MVHTTACVPLKVGSKFCDMEAKSLPGKRKKLSTDSGEQFPGFRLGVSGNWESSFQQIGKHLIGEFRSSRI
jgi:hypothetical protein